MKTNQAKSREQRAESQNNLSKGPGPLWQQAWFQVPHQALVDFGIARERALDARRTARESKLPSVIETARWHAKEARRCWGLAMVGFSPSHSLPVSHSGEGVAA